MAAMSTGSTITARTITAVPSDVDRKIRKVVVDLSAHPDPRWQACFHFVLQGRDGLFLQARPLFDGAALEGVIAADQVDAFWNALPEVIAKADALARAQANKDAGVRAETRRAY